MHLKDASTIAVIGPSAAVATAAAFFPPNASIRISLDSMIGANPHCQHMDRHGAGNVEKMRIVVPSPLSESLDARARYQRRRGLVKSNV